MIGAAVAQTGAASALFKYVRIIVPSKGDSLGHFLTLVKFWKFSQMPHSIINKKGHVATILAFKQQLGQVCLAQSNRQQDENRHRLDLVLRDFANSLQC